MTETLNQGFKHIQAAHCENGVTTSLLHNHGLDFLTEPLAFGMGSGLFYVHIPFLTLSNGPAISFRTMPGAIFSRTCKALGVSIQRKKFSSEAKAKQYVDDLISRGIPVGCQVGVFHLPYFPREYRFHFNAHNLIVYGRNGDNYLVSDPIMETVTELTEEELMKVRFAKGTLAPRGQAYYPVNFGAVNNEMIIKGIKTGIKREVRDMIRIPGPIAGVAGIAYTAKRIRKWRDQLGLKKAGLYLGQIVRMQEEIGTGGGGFRFLYAAFLEEAAEYLKMDELISISEDFTSAGDKWRDSAIQMAGVYKGRLSAQSDFDDIADRLLEIKDIEKAAFQRLDKLKF